MSARERSLRSRLTRLTGGQGLMDGTLVERRRRCGKPACRCATSPEFLHRAVYLLRHEAGRTRQLYVPARWEGRVRQWVGNYHELRRVTRELTRARAGTGAVVRMSHDRWCVENQGFNEMVNRWHADHVYRHDGRAMLALWLLTSLAANVFAAFYRFNLRPALRAASDTLHVARRISAELYHGLAGPAARPRGP